MTRISLFFKKSSVRQQWASIEALPGDADISRNVNAMLQFRPSGTAQTLSYGQFIVSCLMKGLRRHGCHMHNRLCYSLIYKLYIAHTSSRQDDIHSSRDETKKILSAFSMWSKGEGCSSCVEGFLHGLGDHPMPYAMEVQRTGDAKPYSF